MNCVRWSMGEASLHGMGTSLVPGQCFGCHPCSWTKLLPMCPDRTQRPSNLHVQRTRRSAPLRFVDIVTARCLTWALGCTGSTWDTTHEEKAATLNLVGPSA